MRKNSRISFIGTDGMLLKCVAAASVAPATTVERVFFKIKDEKKSPHTLRQLIKYCNNCIPYRALSEISGYLPDTVSRGDLLVSVYNEDLLNGAFLSHFERAVNFHDGPLPKYAGLNAVSWALLDGQAVHGVSWHAISKTFDAGDILLQESFAVPDEWTALNLAVKSVEVGCRLFETLLQQFRESALVMQPQDLRLRLSHRRGELPFGGRFPFRASYDIARRLQRATSYYPMTNPFFAPAVSFGARTLELVQFEVRPHVSSAPLGMVLALDEHGARISFSGGILLVKLVRSVEHGGIFPPSTPGLREIFRVGAAALVEPSTQETEAA